MLAGFSEVEFTPAEGLMPGQFVPYHAKGAHTPLMAHAMVVTNHGTSVMMISTDLLGVNADRVVQVKKQISDAIGIPVANIMICATHTHTGCFANAGERAALEALHRGNYVLAEEEKTIEAGVDRAILEAALTAWSKREEASMGVGRGYERRFSYNRDWLLADGSVKMNPGYGRTDMVRPMGTVDQSVDVLRFDDKNGKTLAFVVNYANHPDNHRPEESDRFSADYPGYLRLALQKEFGNDVAVIFLTGACGDVNNRDYHKERCLRSYRADGKCPPEEMGNGLAETVMDVNRDIIAYITDPMIQCKTERHTTSRRFPTPEQIAWAEETVKRGETEEISAVDRMYSNHYTADTSKLPKNIEMELQTIQIGDQAFVCLPGEIFTEIGLRIKAVSPFAGTSVVTLANQYHGYVATEAYQRIGAYEGRYHLTNAVGFETADVLVNESLRMLRELSDARTPVPSKPMY